MEDSVNGASMTKRKVKKIVPLNARFYVLQCTGM
jgi:hypothetical protein